MHSAVFYYVFAVGMLAFALFVGLRPIAESEPPQFWIRLTPTWAFWLAAAAALVVWRWPAISLNHQINPDESGFIALAHVATVRPIPWFDFDANTSGPFNVWPLTMLHTFGFGFTYAVARATSVVLLLVGVFSLYLLMKRLFGEGAARLSSLFAICFLATASYEPDFAHYSSETVPLCLTGLFALTLLELGSDRTYRSILFSGIAGALAGIIPLAKLQAAPVDAALITIALAVILCGTGSRGKKLAELGGLVFGAFAIVGAVVVPVVLSGAWNDFLISYIREPLWYMSEVSTPLTLNRGQPNLVAYPPFFLLAVLSATSIAISLALSLSKRRPPAARTEVVKNLIPLAAALLTLLAAVYAVMRANEPYAHHLLLLVLPISALTGCSFAAMTRLSGRIGTGRAAAGILLAALVVSSTVVSVRKGNEFVLAEIDPKRYDAGASEIRTASEFALVESIPANSSLTVWGWAPDVYVLRDSIAGTRDAYSQFQMWPGPYRAYYLDRYLNDLQSNKPEYFFDAVRPFKTSYSLTVPQYGLANSKPVARYVSAHYVLVGQVDGLKLYRSRRF